MSAVVAGKKIMSRWEPGAHGTTFGGNPVSCAAAIATMAVIEEEGLLLKVRTAGETVLSRLRAIAADCPVIGDVRGFGFMIGVEFGEGFVSMRPPRVDDVIRAFEGSEPGF